MINGRQKFESICWGWFQFANKESLPCLQQFQGSCEGLSDVGSLPTSMWMGRRPCLPSLYWPVFRSDISMSTLIFKTPVWDMEAQFYLFICWVSCIAHSDLGWGGPQLPLQGHLGNMRQAENREQGCWGVQSAMCFLFSTWYEAGQTSSRFVPIEVTRFKWWGLQQCALWEEAMDPHGLHGSQLQIPLTEKALKIKTILSHDCTSWRITGRLW